MASKRAEEVVVGKRFLSWSLNKEVTHSPQYILGQFSNTGFPFNYSLLQLIIVPASQENTALGSLTLEIHCPVTKVIKKQ